MPVWIGVKRMPRPDSERKYGSEVFVVRRHHPQMIPGPLQIAKKEGRSLAQICELLLRGGIHEYEREGARYLQRLLARPKEKDR